MIIAYFIAVVISMVIMAFCVLFSFKMYKQAKEINPYKEKLSEIKAYISTAESTKKKLNNELDYLNSQIIFANSRIDKANAAESFLSNHAEEIRDKQEESRDIEQKLKEGADKLQSMQNELSSVLSDLEKCKEEALNQRNIHSSLKALVDELESKKEKLEARETELKDSVSKLTNDNTRLQSEHDRLSSDVVELKKEKEKLEAFIAEKQKELESKSKALENFIDKAKKDIADIREKAQKEIDAINDTSLKADTLSDKLSYAEGKISQLNETLNQTEEKKWESLDTPYIKKSDYGKKLIYKEKDELVKFEDALRNNGFIFDSRMIYAFHTGLKTQAISPLVVLAGISGTGKSMLPKLYAQAMGMNFLTVSVQPRWDSPQDMLGFYNYMQGKFSATELSRLLWQFDGYNNPKAVSVNDAPMSIILLDEMNLAKVEYYFSDMLSKLELRRLVDAQNDEDRRKAEIEIEGGESTRKRRLFIGYNNLFVGTMNEDETTQSLSDKVMDRANVLRFGKPETINASPDMDGFSNSYQDDSMLSFSFWNKVVNVGNKLSSVQNDDLNRIIDEFNKQLDRVNRPFAYRVEQAIRSYVINYPEGVNSFKNAISDQVEMKIIPKLNGLDKQDQTVRETLSELENIMKKEKLDPKLIKTFKEVSDNQSNVFFQWRGIPR